ncbi:MAG TPA: MBOAT family O-acyltransferase [Chryseolinea sp.]|nr:MBOAT family O-acyltransferase [Chryseolinea sp.]
MKLLAEVILFAIPMVMLAWTLPRKYVLLSQIIITGLFIGYKSPLSFLILASITFVNYYLLHKAVISKSIKIAISLCILVALIVSAKILFTIHDHWIIPLGMSYYIFRNIHYTIESYNGRIQNESLLFYLAYNFFLPVLIIGPINRYPEFIRDWQRRRINTEYFSLGLQRILFGVSKIVIIGNYLLTSKVAAFISNLDASHAWLKAYLETISLVLNAYFQFAGYSDIAIGISLLLGFRIMENFNFPFLASNMQEFWSKYHMSLSAFCRDYIYTPIASYYRKPMLGIVATMIIIGLWHEITLPFLLWGAFQAAGIYLASLAKNIPTSMVTKNVGRVFVFNYFCLSCVIIDYEQLGKALDVYKTLFFIN